ncbi:hypothetical protein PVIIG_06378 [Plasmodium vivax India VII]|uniref:VIR protein n=1 Tax=Plasmodium vivax India VII TaxID=1077284 RepID=A0A0J9S1J8_PLAVI|nr:hypothetical protein PVIIG_06378 [Plasmodium vivax India VII]
MTEFADILHADIKINNDLIKKDLIENSKSFSPKETETQNQNSGNDLNTQGKDDTQRSTDNAEAKTLGKHTGKEVPTADTERTVHTGATDAPRPTEAKETAGSGGISGTGGNTVKKNIPPPYKFVNYKELSKYNPCFFNYDCTFSECREMKHLYEYFKAYDKIKGHINCEKRQKDKYYAYLNYMSYLYNKHKYDEECCSWGATVCSDYFLECDEYYDPRKLISAIESNDQTKCEKIKNSLIANKSEEISTIDPKDKNNMYIKYLTCSRATHSNFENEGLKCQQPEFNALRNNKFTAVRPVYKAQKSNSKLRGKQLTINGKSINVVLISDPNSIITGEENSKIPELENYNTLFPEIRGAARENYVKQAEEACKNGKPTEGMETYCKRSKRYNDIINGAKLQSRKHIELNDTQNWENIDSPADASFLNDLLQQLPVRMGAVSLVSLGTITMLFMYYKV